MVQTENAHNLSGNLLEQQQEHADLEMKFSRYIRARGTTQHMKADVEVPITDEWSESAAALDVQVFETLGILAYQICKLP